MIPFVSAQVNGVIESIRMLEAFVTAPLGLFSDIKMLRESLPYPEAADLSREELQKRRTAFMKLTDAPSELVLETISSLKTSIDILEKTKGDPNMAGLDAAWVSRARMVLDRAQQKVAGEHRAKIASRIRGLYVIVDPEATKGRHVLEVAEATLRGGTSVLQLRDKINDKANVLTSARILKSLCDQYGALFIMNDDADLAISGDADGLHVGQTDLPVPDARRVLSHRQLVGRSNGTLDEVMDSQAQGVDYIAIGAVYPTETMGKTARNPVGVEMVSKVKGIVGQPVVAIGGINATNIADVARAGADCMCVVSAVTLADDPEASTRSLIDVVQNAK